MSYASVNKVIIVGNLANEPEIHSMGDAGRVASFAVATSEKWQDKDTNTKKEKTQYHRVSVFNQAMVEVTETFLRKGDKVYVEGQLENRKYTDKENVERHSTDVVIRPFRGDLRMLGGKKNGKNAVAEQPTP
jgi:single-strand DNA-binding protein